MVRVKLPLKKVENKTKRNVSFAKRKMGLSRKPMNSLLFVMTEEILKRYIDLPYGKRGRYSAWPALIGVRFN
ncbi:hypothetical protein JRO89_XS10G0039900 [Xanthoceras sorbifolium]|uniref:MADS-box domain-containing protein n=1 Tax=Xanthoceras sorbifolium TaxID=99658 RepID=A0ABQ8HHL4_9ROSI|nr:hypothetical protein JRO89_XS10G0039900 [Xanthoceras sorbifolium]